MQLTTLMEILEREIGASPSARSELALLVAERAKRAKPTVESRATERRTDGRDRSASRAK